MLFYVGVFWTCGEVLALHGRRCRATIRMDVGHHLDCRAARLKALAVNGCQPTSWRPANRRPCRREPSIAEWLVSDGDARRNQSLATLQRNRIATLRTAASLSRPQPNNSFKHVGAVYTVVCKFGPDLSSGFSGLRRQRSHSFIFDVGAVMCPQSR
jgi:hypothetical protein